MKARIQQIAVLVLSFFSISNTVSGQEWFNGQWYQPLPTPDLSSSKISDTTTDNHLIQYDQSSGVQILEKQVGLGQNPMEAMEFGYPGALEPSDAPGVSDRDFSPLSAVSNRLNYPARTAVKLFMTFPNGGNYVGSGALIDSRFVLTAGHCIHDKNLGGWARSITIIPAYDYGASPFGTAHYQTLYSLTGWTNNRDFNWDLGLIRLDRYIGGITGWLGFGYNTSNAYYNAKPFSSHGYPAESPYNGEQMFFQSGTFDQITNRILYFKRLAFGGQSGSGIYDPGRIVHAVLSHTQNNQKTGCVRLNADMFNYFKGLIDLATPNTPNLTLASTSGRQ